MGEGGEDRLLSLCNNTENDTFFSFHSCNSHIHSHATFIFSWHKPRTDAPPPALGPVSNEGLAYVKNQQHFAARVLCGRTNSPCHLTRGDKTLRQQWNLGRSPSLSLDGISLASQRLSLITLSCYRPRACQQSWRPADDT